MLDLLTWTDEATRCAQVIHRERHTFALRLTDACTWTALHARMLAAGLHELRDELLFRAVKTTYLAIVDAPPTSAPPMPD